MIFSHLEGPQKLQDLLLTQLGAVYSLTLGKIRPCLRAHLLTYYIAARRGGDNRWFGGVHGLGTAGHTPQLYRQSDALNMVSPLRKQVLWESSYFLL